MQSAIEALLQNKDAENFSVIQQLLALNASFVHNAQGNQLCPLISIECIDKIINEVTEEVAGNFLEYLLTSFKPINQGGTWGFSQSAFLLICHSVKVLGLIATPERQVLFDSFKNNGFMLLLSPALSLNVNAQPAALFQKLDLSNALVTQVLENSAKTYMVSESFLNKVRTDSVFAQSLVDYIWQVNPQSQKKKIRDLSHFSNYLTATFGFVTPINGHIMPSCVIAKIEDKETADKLLTAIYEGLKSKPDVKSKTVMHSLLNAICLNVQYDVRSTYSFSFAEQLTYWDRYTIDYCFAQNDEKAHSVLHKCLTKFSNVVDEWDNDFWYPEVDEIRDFANLTLSSDNISRLYTRRQFIENRNVSNSAKKEMQYFENYANLIERDWQKFVIGVNSYLSEDSQFTVGDLAEEKFTLLIENIKTYHSALNSTVLQELDPFIKPIKSVGLSSLHSLLRNFMFSRHEKESVIQAFNNAANSCGLEPNANYYSALSFIINAFSGIFGNNPLDIREYVERANALRGWMDWNRSVDNYWRWIFAVTRKEYPDEFEKYLLSTSGPFSTLKNYEYSGAVLQAFNPIDGRGGFSFNTFYALIEHVFAPISGNALSENVFSRTDLILPLLRLTYLYGLDIIALKALIDKEFEEQNSDDYDYKNKASIAHDLGQFTLKAMDVEHIKAWRPFLIKYPSLRKFAGRLEQCAPPQENESLESIKARLSQFIFDNVPNVEGISEHVEHALANGWDQEIWDEFVMHLSKHSRTTTLIPDHSYEYNGYEVKFLTLQDARALYVGELSGCCQHINEGAGNDAAIQSYFETWCRVLVWISKTSGKILAQSFVWLNKEQNAIVLDSVESVHDSEDDIVEEVIIPMIQNWSEGYYTAHNKAVYIGDTDYGITQAVNNAETKSETEAKTSHHSSVYEMAPFAELEYTDVEEYVYLI